MIGEVALANFELPEFMVPAIEPIRALFEGRARHIRGEMAERDMERKEWILVQCFDPFRDAQGNPGERKEPVPDLDTPKPVIRSSKYSSSHCMTAGERLAGIRICAQKE